MNGKWLWKLVQCFFPRHSPQTAENHKRRFMLSELRVNLDVFPFRFSSFSFRRFSFYVFRQTIRVSRASAMIYLIRWLHFVREFWRETVNKLPQISDAELVDRTLKIFDEFAMTTTSLLSIFSLKISNSRGKLRWISPEMKQFIMFV
jgi:hypothetical protein